MATSSKPTKTTMMITSEHKVYLGGNYTIEHEALLLIIILNRGVAVAVAVRLDIALA